MKWSRTTLKKRDDGFDVTQRGWFMSHIGTIAMIIFVMMIIGWIVS